ncbi:DUF4352 domain-containing protein [Petropleomorpha daqingensis]|uniref:DUF4352 domain-containing protein n=1 Tax=Petropleomorpha daqingensis TaxID=2026353 RepID=A0A853C988_9ACTN|nr:DUF4352 domain-containing protein [Petropleomorpha daqingensis]NYJ03877.1 hypothetical protein [Petropleomorpha daqingensis]
MTQLIDAPQPPAPTKKPFFKKTWFLVLAGLTVIAIIGSAISGGKGSGSTSGTAADAGEATADGAASGDTAAAAPDNSDADAGIGQPAADGKFSFVVNGVDCSQTEIGNQYFNTTAQGQFCVVDLTVSNVGDKPQSFFGDNASLFNAQGQEFSADSEAAVYMENADSLYEEINPGNTLSSKVVFDVPAGMVPTSIELHDSMFSGGVTVALQ